MKILNREGWLTEASALFREGLFREKGFRIPERIRLSVGFPSTRRGGRIGECWRAESSADSHGEIFVHPLLDDSLRVLDVVAHELVHTINHHAGQSGHGKVFKDIAVAIGLTGKMTATIAGPELILVLTEYAKVLGPYPHKALTANLNAKRQTTRLHKVSCGGCGYVARITDRWIQTGFPTCVCGTEMGLPEGT